MGADPSELPRRNPWRTTRCLDCFGISELQGSAALGSTYLNRERALKAMLGMVGSIFLASAYSSVIFVRQEPSLSM
jgi:hypothetical protein